MPVARHILLQVAARDIGQLTEIQPVNRSRTQAREPVQPRTFRAAATLHRRSHWVRVSRACDLAERRRTLPSAHGTCRQ